MTTPTSRSVPRTRTRSQRVEICPLCGGSGARLVWRDPRPTGRRVWSAEGYLETITRFGPPELVLMECPCPR